jgi:succinyl-CoA synthetase beta subunit
VPAATPAVRLNHDRLRAAAGGARTAGVFGLLQGAPLLEACGIDVVPARLARTPAEAAEIARDLGTPVAIKIASPDITHKTDVGGVVLGLATPDAVGRATEGVLARVAGARPNARLDGVIVQAMAAGGGVELLLGMVRDPQFGPLVVIGFGGIFVEVLGDTATRLAPVDPAEARTMVGELRMAPALRGFRGCPAVDIDTLAETISRFSHLVSEAAGLMELEINPLLATPAGTCALDVRGRFASSPEEP